MKNTSSFEQEIERLKSKENSLEVTFVDAELIGMEKMRAHIEEILESHAPCQPFCKESDHCWTIYDELKKELSRLKEVLK